MQWIVKETLLAAKKKTLNVMHVYILHEGLFKFCGKC